MTQLVLTAKNLLDRFYGCEYRAHFLVKGVFDYQIDNANKSLFIEIIGCPGVGKSTLIDYMEEKELIKGLICTKLWATRLQRNNKIASAYTSILDYKIMSLEDERVRSRYLRHAIIPRAMDKYIENNKNPTVLLIDEGLFHHFKYEISDNWEQNKFIFSKLMEKRILVHMIARPEIIAERILKRYRETGNLLPYYKNKQECEIIEYCRKAQEKRKKVIRKFKTRGVPVLTINAEDSSQENTKYIDDFVKKNGQ
ncbi:AAA family ATPase [Halomonas sp. TG39a]|uniref:AAA family ATPase n=1 Tax=Halomonas sp. TG39a TaxID=1415755 RepID=UPI00054D3AC0|nr:AAA family ATPase [Halomonas sp. TG39a]